MSQFCIGIFVAICVLAGCANKPPGLPGDELNNPIISSSYAAVDRLITADVKSGMSRQGQAVLVASLVNVDNTSNTSIFGKMMAEQIASRLVQLDLPVIEVKLRSSLYMSEERGEMLLSREIKEISQRQNASAVLVGTYADAGSSGVYVTLKLVRAHDAKVLSATNFMLERKLVSSVINR